MKPYSISYSDTLQKYDNTIYPHRLVINNKDDLLIEATHDHVGPEFANNYRAIETFNDADVIEADSDNDHTEDDSLFITPITLKDLLPGVMFTAQTSKSHMKQKGKFGPRARWHYDFPINKVSDKNKYKQLILWLLETVPAFDSKCKDISHFYAGCANPEVVFVEGNMTLDEYLEDLFSEKTFENYEKPIEEGSRNDTMHKIACKLLVRYGASEESMQKYREASTKCNPPLSKDELNNIWKSASKFYKTKVTVNPEYKQPENFKPGDNIVWDEPLSFEKHDLPSFPIECLPTEMKDFSIAVAEATQTPIDMPATASLAIMALCLQGRYKVQAKPDWIEPLNLYCLIIAEPSERKSAIISLMTRVLIDYEIEYNQKHAASFEFSKIAKQTLESKKKSYETQYMKGKKTKADMMELASEIADFKECIPKKLYVDDITTEKLTSIISDSNGKTGIISSEGGIFDVLSGMYSKNVNIDVFLKSYSGDSIRVDRIGRPSELISNPCLTILLSVQPSVLTSFMQNGTFEGKGLTTRFLYTIPCSLIGNRKYKTGAIPNAVRIAYETKVRSLLEEEEDISTDETTLILTPDASDCLEAFFNENEKAMIGTNQEIKSWCGKVVGNVLRISGILARMEANERPSAFLSGVSKMNVSKENVENAIIIGRYFIEHAKAAHSLMGIDPINKKCEYVIQKLKEKQISEFTKRDIVRTCRTFRTVEEISPIIARLTEYGYIQPKPSKNNSSNIFLVNPAVFTSKNSITAKN